MCASVLVCVLAVLVWRRRRTLWQRRAMRFERRRRSRHHGRRDGRPAGPDSSAVWAGRTVEPAMGPAAAPAQGAARGSRSLLPLAAAAMPSLLFTIRQSNQTPVPRAPLPPSALSPLFLCCWQPLAASNKAQKAQTQSEKRASSAAPAKRKAAPSARVLARGWNSVLRRVSQHLRFSAQVRFGTVPGWPFARPTSVGYSCVSTPT